MLVALVRHWRSRSYRAAVLGAEKAISLLGDGGAICG